MNAISHNSFALDAFEKAAYRRQHEEAAKQLAFLLGLLDRSYGNIDGNFTAHVSALLAEGEVSDYIVTRLTSAITCLFSDPEFNLSDSGFNQLIPFQRWISVLFAASAFKNSDHIIKTLNLENALNDKLTIDEKAIRKFTLLYSPESEIPIDLDALWAFDNRLAISLGCVLISPRFLGSPAAHGKREILLKWLPSKLDQISDLDFLPLPVLHDVYMHCSYADTPSRHDIKRSINRLIRKKILDLGLKDTADFEAIGASADESKKVMMVVLEWFSSQHSIFRTHSRSLEAAKTNFHLIGVGGAETVDAAGRAIFDQFIDINPSDTLGSLKKLEELAQQIRPDVLYMPSVGMFPLSLFVTNVRYAPIQAVALGHPATTHSEFIDFVVVEEDYVGDPECFSEVLFLLPSDGMPYRPSADLVKLEPIYRTSPEVVQIAVASSLMKINPQFLHACREISLRSTTKIHFQFLLGFAQGLVYLQAKRLIELFLPNATVHAHQPYAQYLEVINQCDVYINPFPFGNTNGIIDMTHQNLVGICMTGPEVFQKIDEALFERLNLPKILVADSLEDYVTKAINLVEDHSLRMTLRHQIQKHSAIDKLFTGNVQYFGEQMLKLVMANENLEKT